MRKILIVPFLLLGFSLFAGDIASFVNLGFSDDGKYFLFGQYGSSIAEDKTYAEGFLVDCKKNVFVKQGYLESTSEGLPKLGVDGIGALFNLVRDNNEIIEKYQIDHANSGKIVYLLADGAEPKNKLEFRIFDKKSKVQKIGCELVQKVVDEENGCKSQFHINLKLTFADGSSKDLIVGHGDYMRKDVAGYYIKNVVLSKDYKNIVFVIAKKEKNAKDINIRYMVETLQIQ